MKNLKHCFVAMALLFSVAVVAQTPEKKMTLQDFRDKLPQLNNLDDISALEVLQQRYYPDVKLERMAEVMGITLPAPKVIRKLGPIDKWRYESCQDAATKAPTPQGVNNGLRLCRERFDQSY